MALVAVCLKAIRSNLGKFAFFLRNERTWRVYNNTGLFCFALRFRHTPKSLQPFQDDLRSIQELKFVRFLSRTAST